MNINKTSISKEEFYNQRKKLRQQIEDLKNTLNDMKSMSQNEFEDTYGIKLSTDEFTGIKQSVADFIQTKLHC